jgi:hypothetical protein
VKPLEEYRSMHNFNNTGTLPFASARDLDRRLVIP